MSSGLNFKDILSRSNCCGDLGIMLALVSPHRIVTTPLSSHPPPTVLRISPHSPQSTLFDSVEKMKSGPSRSSVNKLPANLDVCPSRNLTASLAAMAPIVVTTLLVTPRLSQLSLGLETRSEEHTSELQSLTNLVCRL